MNLNPLKRTRTAEDIGAEIERTRTTLAANHDQQAALRAKLDAAIADGDDDAPIVEALRAARQAADTLELRADALGRARDTAIERERAERVAALRAETERKAAELAARVAKVEKAFTSLARDLAEIERAADDIYGRNMELERLGGENVPHVWTGWTRQAVLPRAVGDGSEHWRGDGVGDFYRGAFLASA